MSTKKEMRGHVDIECPNSPGDILVEIVRHLYSKGATVVATATCEALFSGQVPVEDIIFAINANGLELKIRGEFEICGNTSDSGEIDPPVTLASIQESIRVPPGMLQTFEVVEEDEDEPPEGAEIH